MIGTAFRVSLALLSLAAIALIIGVAMWLYRSVTSVELAVPNVIGMEQTVAAGLMKKSRLTIQIIGEAGPDTLAGTVSRTSPPAGAIVKPGRNVLIYVISGEESVTVPQLAGTPLVDAINLLRRAGAEAGGAGLVVGKMTSVESDSMVGMILEQNPAAGTRVKSGSTVDLVVAVETGGAVMPDIVSVPLTQAQETLAAMGYAISAVESYLTSQMPPDMILSQNPPAGTKLAPESLITVRVSVSPILTPGSSYPFPTPTPDGRQDTGDPSLFTQPAPPARRPGDTGLWTDPS